MAEKTDKRRGLGRGLSALMADVSTETKQVPQSDRSGGEQQIPIEQVAPNPDQPRKHFDDDQLAELAASIRENGVIQPLILRQTAQDTYEIVAGERRWRAAQMAQLHTVPAIIREFTDIEVLEIAIIENIQRADLNAVEEAAGYRQLMDRFGHTQEQLSKALGKSRSHIANLLRLLNLPDEVLEFVTSGQLSAGHARTLVTAKDPLPLARKIIGGGLSVRAAEALVKKASQSEMKSAFEPQGSPDRSSGQDADTQALERDLSAALGMRVSIDHKPGASGGKLSISYGSLDGLDTLCSLLSGGHA